MDETIKALFSGKIYPLENCDIKNEEFSTLRKRLNEKRQQIVNAVGDEGLEEYDTLISEINYYFCEHHFCQGFKIGMKLSIEAIK